MTRMIDSEGEDLSFEQNRYFDLNLQITDFTYQGVDLVPEFHINVPMYFETEDGYVYDSGGVLYVNAKEVLEEYLAEFQQMNDGSGIDAFADYLTDYAIRLKAAKKDFDQTQKASTE